jgi:hypothetical protein
MERTSSKAYRRIGDAQLERFEQLLQEETKDSE